MSKQDLLLMPHHPQQRNDVWWYEENSGIYVVMEASRDVKHGQVANTCKITWTSLRAALARKDKKDDN